MGRASGPGSSMAVRGSGAGRGGAHRCGPAGAVRSGKAGLGRRGGREGGAGGPSARASIGPTARIRRPRRRSCPSAPCATVGPEQAGAVWNSEQDRALTISRRGYAVRGGGSGGDPPLAQGCYAQAATLERARPSARRAHPLDRACPSAPLYGSAPALPSASVGPCLSCAARVCMRR